MCITWLNSYILVTNKWNLEWSWFTNMIINCHQWSILKSSISSCSGTSEANQQQEPEWEDLHLKPRPWKQIRHVLYYLHTSQQLILLLLYCQQGRNINKACVHEKWYTPLNRLFSFHYKSLSNHTTITQLACVHMIVPLYSKQQSEDLYSANLELRYRGYGKGIM